MKCAFAKPINMYRLHRPYSKFQVRYVMRLTISAAPGLGHGEDLRFLPKTPKKNDRTKAMQLGKTITKRSCQYSTAASLLSLLALAFDFAIAHM